MTYESDPAGLGVGKRYGPLNLGGMVGEMKTGGAVAEAVFEITFEELDASAAQTVSIPAYSRVMGIYVEVEEVFGAGDTFLVTLDGTTITTAAISVATAGILAPTLTATDANRTTGATAEVLTVNTALIDAGTPLTGAAKVVVQYVAI